MDRLAYLCCIGPCVIHSSPSSPISVCRTFTVISLLSTVKAYRDCRRPHSRSCYWYSLYHYLLQSPIFHRIILILLISLFAASLAKDTRDFCKRVDKLSTSDGHFQDSSFRLTQLKTPRPTPRDISADDLSEILVKNPRSNPYFAIFTSPMDHT